VQIEARHTFPDLIVAVVNLGMDVLPVDLFQDAMMTKLANLDPETQRPVYLAVVGMVEKSVSICWTCQDRRETLTTMVE
jgi:hypothetical protein